MLVIPKTCFLPLAWSHLWISLYSRLTALAGNLYYSSSPRIRTLHIRYPEPNSLSTDACDPQTHPRVSHGEKLCSAVPVLSCSTSHLPATNKIWNLVFLLWFFDISPWSRFSPQNPHQALAAAVSPASSPEILAGASCLLSFVSKLSQSLFEHLRESYLNLVLFKEQ